MNFKKNLKNSKLILVLTKESEIQEKGSISSISFEDLSEDIKNEILKDNKWKILERDVKTNEILEKEKILDIKDFKTIVFEFNNQKKVITKTKGIYVESEFEENLPEIFLFGDNIDEDILNNLANQRVEEKKNKIEAGQLDKIFGSQWNNRK